MRDWIVLGTGPSAPEMLKVAVRHAYIGFVSLTMNAGLKMEGCPTHYFCVDEYAARMHQTQMVTARVGNTNLITLRLSDAELHGRILKWFDEFLSLPCSGVPTRHAFGPFLHSGLLCVQLACLRGASRIHLVGYDGYAADGPLYFDKDAERDEFCKRGDPDRQQRVTAVLREGLQHLADIWHDVDFIQYGEPIYSVNAPNWEMHNARSRTGNLHTKEETLA